MGKTHKNLKKKSYFQKSKLVLFFLKKKIQWENQIKKFELNEYTNYIYTNKINTQTQYIYIYIYKSTVQTKMEDGQ